MATIPPPLPLLPNISPLDEERPTGAEYYYHLKDLLGNTCMTIHYDGSSSTAQVDQEDKLQNKLEKYHPLIRTINK